MELLSSHSSDLSGIEPLSALSDLHSSFLRVSSPQQEKTSEALSGLVDTQCPLQEKHQEPPGKDKSADESSVSASQPEHTVPPEVNGNSFGPTSSSSPADVSTSFVPNLSADQVTISFLGDTTPGEVEDVVQSGVDLADGEILVLPLSPLAQPEQELHEVIVEEITVEQFDEDPGNDPSYPKPRSSNPSKWKRNVVKKLSDSGKAHISLRGKERQARSLGRGCNEKCKRKCMVTFTNEKREAIFKKFWEIENHTMQWYFIGSLVQTENVKRRTKIVNYGEDARRQNTFLYHLPLDKGQQQVCQKAFLDTLGINKTWVRTAMAKKNLNMGAVSADGRGKKSSVSHITACMRRDVIAHIKSFPTVEGHYTRKNSKSLYLPEDLNRRIMHKIYQIQKQAEVDKLKALEEAAEAKGEDLPPGKRSKDIKIANVRQYRDIFRKEFNLKFYRPKKDQCSKCLSWKNKTPEERTDAARIKYEKHLSDKKMGDQLKREDIDLVKSEDRRKTLCVATFDLEKVLLCPRGENSEFFYKSRLSVYNFCIFVSGDQKAFCYCWDQTEGRRGAVEITSCIWAFIIQKVQEGVTEFHFYSDNCSAQNKNKYLFSMYGMASIRFNIIIIHSYLEVGHTHMEVDSVHATIERSAKYKEIFVPMQWYTLFRLAKKNQPFYSVKEMTQDDFFNFSPVAEHQMWEKLKTSTFKSLIVDRATPGVIKFKNEYAQEYKEYNVFKKTPGRPVNWKTFKLTKAYRAKLPVKEQVLKGFKDLCKSGAIPSAYHSFYLETLPGIQVAAREPAASPDDFSNVGSVSDVDNDVQELHSDSESQESIRDEEGGSDSSWDPDD